MQNELLVILGLINTAQYKQETQGRIKTKLGLMLQPRKGTIFLSIDVSWRIFIRHSPVTTDKKA